MIGKSKLPHLYAMGSQAENIFKSFTFNPPPAPTDANPNPLDPKDNYDVVLKKYDAYFVSKRNTIYERAKFYQRTQEPGELIECFERNLHEFAPNCRFKERETENMRDRLISGMSDKEMSLKLQLEHDDLTLVKAAKMIDCLMSRSVACRMGLIKKIENVEVFQGLGCLKMEPVKILRRDCPAVCPECRPMSAHSSPTQEKGGAGKAGVGGHHREDYRLQDLQHGVLRWYLLPRSQARLGFVLT